MPAIEASKRKFAQIVIGCGLLALALAHLPAEAQLGEEQAAEKVELENMKREMTDIKLSADDAIQGLNKINTQAVKQHATEIHLFCKEALCEIAPGIKVNCLTYNGHIPGPAIVVSEGQLVRLVLHNQLKIPTSLHLHGLVLPQAIDGLPRNDAGLIKPGESYAFQFIAQPKGTYWYHPQIIHAEQKAKGLSGAFIVEPSNVPGSKTYDREIVIVFSDLTAVRAKPAHNSLTSMPLSNKSTATQDIPKVFNVMAPTNQTSEPSDSTTLFLMNGQSAPAVPPIELTEGLRVRMHLINAGQNSIPLHLSGHCFEVVAINGDLIQTQMPRDTVTLGVSDRVDIEFTANNPGVWSLGSEKVEQTTSLGKFPGGIACVVRYIPK